MTADMCATGGFVQRYYLRMSIRELHQHDIIYLAILPAYLSMIAFFYYELVVIYACFFLQLLKSSHYGQDYQPRLKMQSMDDQAQNELTVEDSVKEKWERFVFLHNQTKY